MKCSQLTRGGVTSLTYLQTQLILGTLLGDGHLRRQGTKYPAYCMTHGAPQRAYLQHKAEILAPLIRTPLKPAGTSGFGSVNWQANTLTTELLTPFLDLCYPVGKKMVSQRWLALIELPALAYWYMDDGSLSNGYTVKFHTQGFWQVGTEMLASWLTKQGFDAFASLDRGKYWHVELGVESGRKLLTAITPLMHASMLYKAEIKPALPMISCACCGKTIQAVGKQCAINRPVCGAHACLRWQNNEWAKEYMTPERRARKAIRVRARRQLNPELARAKARQYYATWQKNKRERAALILAP